jgi:hypothetical protein
MVIKTIQTNKRKIFLKMENQTIAPTNQDPSVKSPKTGCGCAEHKHDDLATRMDKAHEDCPCAKKRKRQRMIIGGVILIVLGVAAYGAYRMGYFDKVFTYFKKTV